MKRLITVALLLAVPQTTMASEEYEYEYEHECAAVARDDRISRVALTEKLEAEGWQVRRVKLDDGCWEVYGTTPEGQRVEGYFHPATGEPLLLEQDDRVIFRAED